MTGVLIRMPCDDRQRLEWCVYKSRKTRDCRQTAELGRGKEGLFPRACKGSMVLSVPWFWTSNLQNSKRINFYTIKPLSLLLFVMVAIGTNTQALKKHLLKNKWDLENKSYLHFSVEKCNLSLWFGFGIRAECLLINTV